MDTIIKSVIDISKYHIISTTDTGDKTMDNLINTFYISIITFLVTFNFKDYVFLLYYYIKSWFYDSNTLNKHNINYYYKKYLQDKQYNSITWYNNTQDGKNFINKLYMYMININYKGNSITRLYNFRTKQVENDLHEHKKLNSILDICIQSYKNFCKQDKYMTYKMPIYLTKNKNVIGLLHNGLSLSIQYKTIEELQEFIDMIQNQNSVIRKNKESEYFKNTIYDMNGNKCDIYDDKKFDNLVTKHKHVLLESLDRFKQSLEGKSPFNGFGTYNLGLMLYGYPGTGKTSVIKAVCSYLNRDGYVINLRKIKKAKEFIEIINEYGKTHVLIFEEFDCLQGVVKKRNGENINDKQEQKQLREEYFKLLSIQTDDKDTKKEQLEKIELQIEELDNKLTLDTILTTLDGMYEMRGRVIIATTNHINDIDGALMRPGRFDLKLHLDKFDNQEIHELLEKMFEGNMSEKERKLLETTSFREYEFSPAEIIGICCKYGSLIKVIQILQQPVSELE